MWGIGQSFNKLRLVDRAGNRACRIWVGSVPGKKKKVFELFRIGTGRTKILVILSFFSKLPICYYFYMLTRNLTRDPTRSGLDFDIFYKYFLTRPDRLPALLVEPKFLKSLWPEPFNHSLFNPYLLYSF